MIKYITTIKELPKLNPDLIGLDFETTGVDIKTLKPLLLGITDFKDYYAINLTKIPIDKVKDWLYSLEVKKFIMQNAKFDLSILNELFNYYHYNIHCTMVQAQILLNGLDIPVNYKNLVKVYLDIDIVKDEVQSFIGHTGDFDATKAQLDYLYADLIYLRPLYLEQMRILERRELLEVSNLELEFLPVLTKMCNTRIKINVAKFKNLNIFFRSKAKAFEQEFFDLLKELDTTKNVLFDRFDKTRKEKSIEIKIANQIKLFDDVRLDTDKIIQKFNINSSTQIMELFKRLKLPIDNTNESTLNIFTNLHPNHYIVPLIKKLLDVREYNKLISMYNDAFLNEHLDENNTLSSNYGQCDTSTGRLNSSNPNLQNIPRIKELRNCFIPDSENYLFYDFDLSGQELKILASQSQDEVLLKSENKGLDLHSYLAQGSYRIITGELELIVTKEINSNYRNNHKPVLFGWIYGAGVKRISSVLNVSNTIAGYILNWLKNALPKVTEYQNKVKENALRRKEVRDGSFTNRYKRFNITGGNSFTEDYKIEKESANFPIQSTGASMIKLCMINISKYIRETNYDIQIKFTVHDEVVLQIPKLNHEFYVKEINQIVLDTCNLFLTNVKMKSEYIIADCWDKC